MEEWSSVLMWKTTALKSLLYLVLGPWSLVLGLESKGETMVYVWANSWHSWNFQRAMEAREEMDVGVL